MIVNNLPEINAKVNAMIKVYRLIKQYVYIVPGLKSDLSCAWKSGKKPSPINEIIKNKLPSENKVIGWST